MFKNRTILLALLIPLLLDLLVFFSAIPASSKNRTRVSFEQSTEELLVESICECEEEVEETETLCAGLALRRQAHLFFAKRFSKKIFHSPSSSAPSLAFGWIMPLLI